MPHGEEPNAHQGERETLPVRAMPNGTRSGADRDRTGDPRLAKPMLSQLSYSPNVILRD